MLELYIVFSYMVSFFEKIKYERATGDTYLDSKTDADIWRFFYLTSAPLFMPFRVCYVITEFLYKAFEKTEKD